MSFTVSQRTREIGIRIALGANRRHIIATVFRRPVTLVALGVLAGGAVVAAAVVAEDARLSFDDAVVSVAYATLMMGVCLLASIVPTRRALSVEPGEALRMEG
jgi:ABC-type antimicrobial peptide transport system permease subunit